MEKKEIVKRTTEQILGHLAIPYSSIVFEEGPLLWITIETSESAMLIGRGGDTIRALNQLVQKIVSRECGDEVSLTIDVNGYKKKEKDRIIQKAKLLGDRAKNFRVNIKLDPMSAYERLIIHEYFSTDPLIHTESAGEGRDRHVVLKYTEPVSNDSASL